jgi:HTH-type transcriptional regulator/antitoxin MqsA
MDTAKSRTGELCPICSEGHLTSLIGEREVSHAGHSGKIPYAYSQCDFCESDIVGQSESVLNLRALTEFKKSAEELLTGKEIKQFREEFHITQELAAALFGGGKIGFSRYERDEITQSLAMDNLIRLCAIEPYNLELLASLKSIVLPAKCINKIRDGYLDILKEAQQRLDAGLTAKLSTPKKPANDDVFLEWQAPDAFNEQLYAVLT